MSTALFESFRRRAQETPRAPAYGERVAGQWHMTGWQDYYQQVRKCARAFMSCGLGAQEKVCLLGNNRPEWAISCLAAGAAGAVPVGIYQTCSAEQVAFVVNHSEARIVVIEDLSQWAKIEAARSQMPALEHVVMMRAVPDAALPADGAAMGWNDFLKLAERVPDSELESRLEAITPDDLASMIYTSGTTGQPKAVMLSHGNVVETCRIGQVLHDLQTDDSLVSYLPMAHIAEQMMSVHMPAFIGYTPYFLDSPLELLTVLAEVQPTIFFGVPRVWERFHSGISEKLRQVSLPGSALISWAISVGLRRAEALNRGTSPGLVVDLQWKLADGLLLRKIRTKIGLRDVRIAVSGAAPVAREILDFFAGLGVAIYEVYGLSETTGPGTWNYAGHTRLGTVGPALPEVEMRIADDGEVLLRGPNVFQGYFKSPAATAEALDVEGWFHTGDLGSVDIDGFLTITGRKKEILITSGGKNIAPAGIESKLKQIGLVGDAMVIGDGRRFIAALLTLDEDAFEGFASDLDVSVDGGPAHENPQVQAVVREGIHQVNSQLARVETVRNFRLLSRRFSPEAGELTPTLKVKRRVVTELWRDEIEAMYAEGQVVSPDGR